MKNNIGETGYFKVRRCTVVINATEWDKKGTGFVFYEAQIKEIYYTAHPEVKVEQIPGEYKKEHFYRVGDILKIKDGRVFYKTRDKISSDL